jgi:hypothetical protein
MPKIEPSEMTLRFSTPNFNGVRTFFIDLSQVASLVNRRFYRQGLNWGVAGFKILSAAPDTVGAVTISKLPNTWVMSNAWHKSFASWQQMNREALEETESIRPRFLDFKIYADSDHHIAGFGANLLPNSRTTTALPGEWESSKISVPYGSTSPGNSVDRELLAVGANYPGISPATGANAVSVIEGYAASRGLPNVLDPNVPDDASDAEGTAPANWMAALSNKGTDQTEDVLENMITENNIAPYPFENDGVSIDTMYPGGENQLTGLMIHDESLITTTTIGGITRLKGGNFPCGLIRIDVSRAAAETGNYLIQIEMIPGEHRGYLAESMQDM